MFLICSGNSDCHSAISSVLDIDLVGSFFFALGSSQLNIDFWGIYYEFFFLFLSLQQRAVELALLQTDNRVVV